jgi:hypothetical protein
MEEDSPSASLGRLGRASGCYRRLLCLRMLLSLALLLSRPLTLSRSPLSRSCPRSRAWRAIECVYSTSSMELSVCLSVCLSVLLSVCLSLARVCNDISLSSPSSRESKVTLKLCFFSCLQCCAVELWGWRTGIVILHEREHVQEADCTRQERKSMACTGEREKERGMHAKRITCLWLNAERRLR